MEQTPSLLIVQWEHFSIRQTGHAVSPWQWHDHDRKWTFAVERTHYGHSLTPFVAPCVTVYIKLFSVYNVNFGRACSCQLLCHQKNLCPLHCVCVCSKSTSFVPGQNFHLVCSNYIYSQLYIITHVQLIRCHWCVCTCVRVLSHVKNLILCSIHCISTCTCNFDGSKN